jgi:hypothetical protein
MFIYSKTKPHALSIEKVFDYLKLKVYTRVQKQKQKSSVIYQIR